MQDQALREEREFGQGRMVVLAGFDGQNVLPVAPTALSAPPAATKHGSTKGS